MAQYLYAIDTGITTTSLNGISYPGGISVGQTTYDLLIRERFNHGVIPIENTTGYWYETNDNVGIFTSRSVGIGTTNPTSKLQVVTTTDGDGLRLSYDNTPVVGTGAALVFTNKNNASTLFPLASVKGIMIGGGIGAEAGGISFNTVTGGGALTERMRIADDGNVLFNTTSNPLPTNSSGVLNIVSDGAASRDVINIKHTKNGNNSINIWQTGATPFQALSFYKGNVQTIVGSIVVTTTATSYTTGSDYRIKENVVPLTGAIDRLNNLQVHRFNFVANPNLTVDGFLAHEAQTVVPECVTGDKDAVDDDDNPIYQSIDQSKLVPLLTAALQEAIARIETLEAAVAALQGA